MTNPYNSGTRWDTFGIRSDLFQELQEVAPKKETIDHLVESEKEMAGRLDLLDPIMDFGQSYMPTGLNFGGTGKLPFRNQRGPSRGVRIENDGIRLLGAGAWQIMCDIRPEWVLVTPSLHAEIRCYAPDGSLYTYQKTRTSNTAEHSIVWGADFIVPEPNYFVSVHVTSVGSPGRRFYGGWSVTRLVAKRWSSEFINPPTGGAVDAGSEG